MANFFNTTDFVYQFFFVAPSFLSFFRVWFAFVRCNRIRRVWVSVDVFHLVCWWMIVISVVWRQTRAQHSLCEHHNDRIGMVMLLLLLLLLMLRVHFYSNNAIFSSIHSIWLLFSRLAMSRFLFSAFCLITFFSNSLTACTIPFRMCGRAQEHKRDG